MTNNEEIKDNQNQEIALVAPEALSKDELKEFIINDIQTNVPEYFQEVASACNFDLESQKDLIDEIAYKEQLALIADTALQSNLDEDPSKAYNDLMKLCYFSEENLAYLTTTEGESLPSTLPIYIESRLSNIDEIKPFIDFTKDITEASVLLNTDAPNFTSYKTNQIRERLEETPIMLSNNQKAQLSFIFAKLYRKLNSQQNPYADNTPSSQETDCLLDVLAISDDYKLISSCQNRLSKEYNKNVLRALQKASNNKEASHNDLYKINMDIADLYLKDASQIGFTYAGSEKTIAGQKAIKHLKNAAKYASKTGPNIDKKERILPIYKKISNTQDLIGDIEGWKETKKYIAEKILNGASSCIALISLGEKTGDLSLLEQAQQKCAKTKINKSTKTEIYNKIISGLNNMERLHKVSPEQIKNLQQTTKAQINMLSPHNNVIINKGKNRND